MHFGEDETCEPICNIRPAAVREMMKQLVSYMDEDTKEWGQKMWDDEVKKRPGENMYREMLNNCWRRVKEFQF